MLFLRKVKQNLMKSISTLLLCSVIVTSLKAQWSIDTKVNNLISNESVVNFKSSLASVIDVFGNTYAFWAENRNTTANNKDIYAQKINKDGVKLWATDKIICNAPNDQPFGSDVLKLVYNGSDRIFIIWSDERNSASQAGDPNIYFQCIDLDGNLQYNNLGQGTLGVPLVTATRVQTAISAKLLSNNTEIGVAWQDNRTTGGTNYDVYVSKINITTGTVSPEVNLIDNSVPGFEVPNSSQSSPRVEADNNGGFYIAWLDKRYLTSPIGDEIFMQRVNNSLAPQWAASGISVSGESYRNASNFSITKDGTGGVYIAWTDQRSAGFNGNVLGQNDVYAMRYSNAGAALWPSSPSFTDITGNPTLGSGVRVTDCTNDQEKPLLVLDPNNNVIVTWVDERVGNGKNDLFTQKLRASDGTFIWAPSVGANGADCGVVVSALPGSNQPSESLGSIEGYNFNVMSDNAGGIYVVWADNRDPENDNLQLALQNINDLYVQHIVDGSPLSCPVNGRLIANGEYPDSTINNGTNPPTLTIDYQRRNQQKPVSLPLTQNDGMLVLFFDGKDNKGSLPQSNTEPGQPNSETSIYAQIVSSICNLGTLSANFENVNASITGNIVNVNWKVINAQNTTQFIVERSKDGIRFETIGTVNANGLSNYEAADVNPYKGINYYRVISVDVNGTRKTSRIVQVQFNNKTTIVRTMPNPVTDKLFVIWAEENIGKHQIRIYTNSGQLLQSQEVLVQANSQSTVVSTKNLAAGVYLVNIVNANGNAIVSKTIIKQ
jgi:hypothetical protein